jgi:hypothetical protein
MLIMLMQNVRQHALSMLTDSFLDKRSGLLPVQIVCDVLGKTCIPLAGMRIIEMRDAGVQPDHLDTMLIELELCVGLIFKPVRHHIKTIVNEGPSMFMAVWLPILKTLKEVMSGVTNDVVDKDGSSRGVVIQSLNELTMDHLRNVITVMISLGVLRVVEEGSVPEDDISHQTWMAISTMEFCKTAVAEWKLAAASPPIHNTTPDVGIV